MKNIFFNVNHRNIVMVFTLMFLLLAGDLVFAHGERAQQAGLRMRTLNWFDIELSSRVVEIGGDELVVTGKFVASKWWPKHMASIEEAAFLNVGVPGPVFVRTYSAVNGVPMIRSTSFKKGEVYNFEMRLKPRTPGRYHLHPVISVKDAGPIIGPGKWVEVKGDPEKFSNTIETLTGEVIDLESYGMKDIVGWHAFWLVIGLAWLFYWFRNAPVLMPRYKQVEKLGEEANSMITVSEMLVSVLFIGFVLLAIAASYFWTNHRYPVTTALQTGEVEVPIIKQAPLPFEIRMDEATYRIPGRSFQIQMTITNNGDKPLQIGEFSTANIRFVNSEVLTIDAPEDPQDLVAPNGLSINSPAVQAGETKTIIMTAEDALWETYRLTSLIYDPDSRFAGLLFLFDSEGKRYFYEIGGQMIPSFT